MNKKLLTLAVAGAIVGGMGVAQADVTVYGKAAVSIDSVHVDTNTGYANDGNLVVANNSSRLGFKFSEDLGGSFFKKALGQYEATVTIDGEGTGLFGGAIRNSYLGLETAGGTVLAGIHDTPFKIIGRNVELFPEYVGDARNLISVGGTGSLGWDLRPTNVVGYVSPTMAGVSLMVAWVADGGAANANTDNNSNTALSASVSYKGGPVYVAAAYEKHDSNLLSAATAGFTGEDETAYRVVASGTFGIFKVVGLYQGLSDNGGVSGADRDTWGLGASATLAEKHVIKAQYYSAGDIGSTADSGADMYAVAYDYKFSKKTTGYLAYAKTSNGLNGTFTVNSGGHGDTLSTTATAGPAANSLTGVDVSAVSMGMYMDF